MVKAVKAASDAGMSFPSLTQFFTDTWCLFDLFIVSMSLISLGPVDLPARCRRQRCAHRRLTVVGPPLYHSLTRWARRLTTV